MMRGLALIGLAVAVTVLVPVVGLLLVPGLAAWIFVTRSAT